MNKKIYLTAAMIFGGLIVGATVEHVRLKVSASEPEPLAEEPEVVHHVQKVIRPVDTSEKDKLIDSLNAKVASLSKELDALRATNTELVKVQKEEENESPEARDNRRRESFEKRMERMKTEDPERYAEMQKRREEFKTRMEERKQTKREFLASVSTDNMTDDQKVNHERLVALNERVNEIMEQMMSGNVENRQELHDEMHKSFDELRELNELEQDYLLEQTANAAGFEGDDAAVFTETIQSIIENTTVHGPGGRGGPPGGGRSGRGG